MPVAQVDHDERFASLPTAGGLLSRLAAARVSQAGIALAPLLKKARLTASQIEDDHAPLIVQSQIRFVELAAQALGDPFLGFHLAGEYDLREVGLLYYVLASSDTLGEALKRAARYSRTVNEGIALQSLRAEDLTLTINYVGVARLSDRHQIEFWMAGLLRVCRQLTGRNLAPQRVGLIHHRSEGTSEIDAFFGVHVRFGAAADEIVFPAAVKTLPTVGADPYLNELLTGYSEKVLAERAPGSRSVRADMENVLAPLLPHGARMEDVARRLGISERTLARRLAAEGLTFSTVLNELRADLAKHYVRDPALSISRIAWLLGYHEASAFTHAFRRWTGKTPRQMRVQDVAH